MGKDVIMTTKEAQRYALIQKVLSKAMTEVLRSAPWVRLGGKSSDFAARYVSLVRWV